MKEEAKLHSTSLWLLMIYPSTSTQVMFKSVWGLAGIKFIFFVVDCMVLHLGFVTKASPVFWLLLSTACTASRLSVTPTQSPSGVFENLEGV